MDKQAIKFPENVLVIDTYFLNALIEDMKHFYDEKLKRTIENIDIPNLLDYFVLDMGVRGKENKCLVIWIYDAKSEKISFSNPSDIAGELSGKGFDDHIASFEMIGAPCKELVPRKDLMLNILELITDAKEVKRIGVMPEDPTYSAEVIEKLKDIKLKEAHVFVTDTQKVEQNDNLKAESVFFPILAGMGINGDEI